MGGRKEGPEAIAEDVREDRSGAQEGAEEYGREDTGERKPKTVRRP